MEGINVGLLLDVFLIVFGGYLVCVARNMKKTGKPGNMLLDAEELARCRDSRKMAEEVARYMLPFGAETVLCGIAGTVNMIFYKSNRLNTVILFAFLIVCLWFVTKFRHIREKFL